MSEKKKQSNKKKHSPVKKVEGNRVANKGNVNTKKKTFSYENSYEEFEDLDFELMDKLNKGKLIKGNKNKGQGSVVGAGKGSVGTKAPVKEKVSRGNKEVQGQDNRAAGSRGSKRTSEGSNKEGINRSNKAAVGRINKDDKRQNNRGEMGRGSKENDKIADKRRTKRVVKPGECPYIRQCGGCNILKKSYEEELQDKQKLVEGLISKFCKVEPIIGMKNPRNYRNKVHVVFDHDRKGNPVSGVYEEGTHRVVPVEQCCIHNQKADDIIATIRGMLKSFKIKTYDEDSGYGLLRHVLVRTGYSSGEIMVVLVLASPILPSKNNFVKALRAKHPEITTVVLNINDKQTSMVLGDKEQVIYGKGFIEDRLCDKVFRLSPKSFYQVNPAQTEVLYKKAIGMAKLTGMETVIDAYCGIGTIGIIASDYAKKVIGVELNKDAVKDANINAKRNEAKNIEFFSNDAGVFMSQMAEQKESADVVFMDPPRSGSTEQFMDAVAELKPGKVVYISCSPVTLERDLQYLTKKGYKAVKAVPVDMFPWTGHVEVIIILTISGQCRK